jgi:hypothetical protein
MATFPFDGTASDLYDLIDEVTVCNLQLRDGRSMEEEMVIEVI